MDSNLKDFWQRLQTGIEVSVASAGPETLLGVRDAFLRYFHQGLGRTISVAIVPQDIGDSTSAAGLPSSDEETIGLAEEKASLLAERLGGDYHFYVASEGGLQSISVHGETRSLIRSWTVVRSPIGMSWGGSGSIQLPQGLFGELESLGGQLPIPGTRRRGGIISSLTGGSETRRSSVGVSTFNALSTLFYGLQ